MFHVYVLRSQRDRGLYIGYSGDLKLRLRQHEDGNAKATAGRRPLKLVYYEAYLAKEDAKGRERFLIDKCGRAWSAQFSVIQSRPYSNSNTTVDAGVRISDSPSTNRSAAIPWATTRCSRMA